MPTPPDPEPPPSNVFLAYDFEIGGTLPANLSRVKKEPRSEWTVNWPGSPDGQNQGAIWKGIVRRGIIECDRLLAFVDLPNANVGFEVGYGLGLGKAVALARVQPQRPSWLDQPPLHGFLCPLLETPDEIRGQVKSPDTNWVQVAAAQDRGGTGVLVLCPGKTGAAYREMLPDDWGWRTLPSSGWDLHDLPEKLAGIGLIVWVIAPHNEGPSGRDGRENAMLSVIAGYGEARPEIDLRILQSKGSRGVVDVTHARTEFTDPDDFASRLKTIKAEWDAKNSPKPVPTGTPVIPLDRPRVEPLPIDDWADIPARFIGRLLQLNDVAEAVEGLLHRASTGETPMGSRAVKVIWVHGFGGMGKSWFLHRSRLKAGHAVKALIVDWDSTVWRYPLTGEPRSVTDLFEPIAYRLVQNFGVEAADPYWLAKGRVRSQAQAYQRLRDQFEGQLSAASGRDRVSSPVLSLLDKEGVWVDDPAKRARNLEALRRDPDRYRNLFVSWCHANTRDADEAAIDPDETLAAGLRESLRQAARECPVVLLADTCEVLADLDRWLLRLLLPLCRDETPLLVLVGSRLAPDVGLVAGSREGWQAEIPGDRFRPVPFNELVRFGVEEIEAVLRVSKKPLEGDPGEVAERLHRLTRGVPLAVRAILDLHETADGCSLIGELAEDDEDDPLDESEAIRKVIGDVARRMLYHLAPERKPEREDDLRDIIALALLQRADEDVLKHLWAGRRVRKRLVELGTRYALLSGGDMHATVRDYLRRFWRDENERPDVFDSVLDSLEQAVESLPPIEEATVSPESLARQTLRLNLSTWREGDRAVDGLARLLAVSLAHEEEIEDIQALLGELPLDGDRLRAARKLWKSPVGERPDTEAITRWLRGICDASASWSDRERASLALVQAISSERYSMETKDALASFSFLGESIEYFGTERLPQKQRVSETFSSVARALDPFRSHNQSLIPQAIVAYQSAIEFGSRESSSLCDLGDLYLQNLRQFDDAERAYLSAIEADPKDALAHYRLGDLYRDHMGRPDDAERAYLKAVETDPKYSLAYYGLGNLYRDHMGRPDDAEQAYLRAIEADPESDLAHYGLGNLYRDHMARFDDAEQAYLRAVEIDPKFRAPHYGLGTLYRDHMGRPDEAEQAYLRAAELDPKNDGGR